MRPFLTHFARVRFTDLVLRLFSESWDRSLDGQKRKHTALHHIRNARYSISFFFFFFQQSERREFWRKRRSGDAVGAWEFHQRGEYVVMHMYTIIEIHKRWSVYLLLQTWKYTNTSSCTLLPRNALFVNISVLIFAAELAKKFLYFHK